MAVKKVSTMLKEQIEKKNSKQQLWDLTMSNIQRIGNKQFVFVPMDLIFIDERFQRVEETSKGKINQLVRNWNDNKLDALKGSLHPEELRISIIDGYHRVMAALILGLPGLIVEVLQNMPDDPKERLIAEATLFATQTDDVNTLTPVQKHKANVLRGVKENVIVSEAAAKYHITLKKNPSHGRVQAGQLAGFTMALGVAKTSGKEMLETVFGILCETRWDTARSGLSSNAIHAVYNILRLHPEHKTEIYKTLVEVLTPMEPDQLFAQAYAKYPTRKERERILLFTEDIICEKLKISRVYHGGSVTTALTRAA